MSRDFRVVDADISDLDAAFALLERRSIHPEKKHWQRYSGTLSCSETTVNALNQEVPFVIIDKIGVRRGFFILCRRSHLQYPGLLDVLIVGVENGPNENHIARAIFDYALNVAYRQQLDAVHFRRMSEAWDKLPSDPRARCEGILMPLDRDARWRQNEPSKSSTAR